MFGDPCGRDGNLFDTTNSRASNPAISLHSLWLICRCAIHTLWNQSGADNRGGEYPVAGAIVWKRWLQRPAPKAQ